MFFDDEIVEYVINNKSFEKEKIREITTYVFNMCMDRMKKEITDRTSVEYAKASIIRVCNLWDSAARKLKVLDYNLLIIGGFKDFLINDKKFKPLMQKIGIV